MAEKFWGKVLGTTTALTITLASVPVFWGEVAVKLIKRDESDFETLKFAARLGEAAAKFGDENDERITREAVKKAGELVTHVAQSYVSDKIDLRLGRHRRNED